MKRSTLVVSLALVAAAIAVGVATLWDAPFRRSRPLTSTTPRIAGSRDAAARARLLTIPLYRGLVDAEGLRSASLDDDGTLHLDVDLRSVAGPRLTALGLGSLATLLPASAQGTIAPARPAGTMPDGVVTESWLFPGSTPALDLLDRSPAASSASPAWDAVPGKPSAAVGAHVIPRRLADPSFGGPAFAPWRDRLSVVETLLGRPLRLEFAEDLAGPVVFALYDDANDSGAEAILAVELRRSDRIAGLLDTLFGLGALTERATIRRYRGVATGSFGSESGGPGVALAVDGPLLLVGTSRARLESAIDARRLAAEAAPSALDSVDGTASWSAMSTSMFVAHGWLRLARAAGDPAQPVATMTAVLRPVGSAGWRLEGHGPSPAITADPIVPFVRTVLGRRQREGD